MRKFAWITGEQPMGKGAKKVWFQWASAGQTKGILQYDREGTLASLVIPANTEPRSQLEKNGYIIVASLQEMLDKALEALLSNEEERREVFEKRNQGYLIKGERDKWQA